MGQDGKKGEYKWETYKDVYEKMKNFGAGLRKVGVTEVCFKKISSLKLGIIIFTSLEI